MAESPSPHLEPEVDLVTEMSDPTDMGHAGLHTIVQLIQCKQCSRPLRTPLRLPCGNTVCRECLPPSRMRTGITYPVAEGRDQEFTCPWKGTEGCIGDHCIGDCSADVLLAKLAGVFEQLLAGADNAPRPCQGDGNLVRWRADETHDFESAQLERGCLEGIYRLASEGSFPCAATDVIYETNGFDGTTNTQDLVQQQNLQDNLRAELDCQVCYALLLDPMTTACGHTFCQRCVERVLDHADLCPICRRKLGMPRIQAEPINKTISRLIDYFFLDQIAARREIVAQDETGPDYEKNLPLFVCTLSFPTMPTFLHVFEPRYRLMIRRVIENGNGKFGMVMYNRRGRLQLGHLDDAPFMQYGTLLMIERYELLPDGRSLVVATGVSRFKITDSVMLDGYYVAKTERVEDIPLAEEERLEALETSSNGEDVLPESIPSDPELDSMSTQQLLLTAREFISNQRRSGAPWLHPRVMLAYGPIPVDAARFPWWFASILPISEEEKYPILSATSVRERLKVSAKWARQLEARDWSTRPLSGFFTSLSPSGFTTFSSFTPLSFSISISFGGSGLSIPETAPQISHEHDQHRGTETPEQGEAHIPQVFVIGAFFAIFFAQVGVNFLHAVRNGRRRRRLLEMQFPHPLPQRERVRVGGTGEPPDNTNARGEPVADNTDGHPVPVNAPVVE
ncbi:unnamed protein product [Penicillium salamii]|uniref:Zinc finger, RING-type n=1 Tax=Penicillium salamii TaxID=1612424 RepID=A0A9W4JJF3_9EURO|nr:unnamed protein product [Penicillium salamii]CAG8079184.1 unnamed protein product [Penicillium salamii]CAG8117600.1 unnamed protein product [Penicillium salamii]CAG8130789.1 unnamed protein product [Penicillium salamii]CAG8266241.1 unnamed protein product [Penicillium salamii]